MFSQNAPVSGNYVLFFLSGRWSTGIDTDYNICYADIVAQDTLLSRTKSLWRAKGASLTAALQEYEAMKRLIRQQPKTRLHNVISSRYVQDKEHHISVLIADRSRLHRKIQRLRSQYNLSWWMLLIRLVHLHWIPLAFRVEEWLLNKQSREYRLDLYTILFSKIRNTPI